MLDFISSFAILWVSGVSVFVGGAESAMIASFFFFVIPENLNITKTEGAYISLFLLRRNLIQELGHQTCQNTSICNPSSLDVLLVLTLSDSFGST